MATSVGEAFLKIVPDVSRFKSDLSRQVEPAVTSSAKRLGGKMQGFGLAMTAGVTAPLTLLAKSSIDAFQESEKVTAQTQQVIESTGKAAGVTASQVEGLASSISSYSGIDDEAIQSGSNLLLTFTKIQNQAGKGNDIFNRATATLADMSTALGTDVKGSAIQLGKALNDPVKGISALSRVGVSFSDKQKAVIKRLAETGDTAGAQRVILDELSKEFGGQAKAFGDTSAGAAAKAKVSWGNAMEDIGAALAPVVTQIAELAGKIASWFSGLPSGVKTAIVVVGALLAVLGPVVGLIGTIITIAPAVGAAFTFMLGPVGLIILAIAALVAIVILVIKHFDTIKRVALGVWHAIGSAVGKAADAIKGAFSSALDWVKRNWKTLLAILTGPIGIAVLLISRNWGKIKAGASAVLDWLKGAWRSITGVVRSVWDGIKRIISGVWDGIKAVISTGVNVLIGALNDVIRGLNVIIKGVNLVKPGADIAPLAEIQPMARGGIVLSPTVALLGERGPEAVVPLGRGGGGPLQIEGRLSIDEEGIATIRGVVRDEMARGAAWSRAVASRGGRP